MVIAVLAIAAAAVPVTTAALAFNPLDPDDAVSPPHPSVSLTATPRTVTISPLHAARYRIAIHRHHFRGRVTLGIIGRLPPGVRATFAPRLAHGSGSTLWVTATTRARRGHYRIRLRAVGDPSSARLSLSLTISAPTWARLPFAVGGSVSGLYPGEPGPLNLQLTNPNGTALKITGLGVSIERIHAPNATAALPCSLADFSLQQFGGYYPLYVPAMSSRKLDQLGIPSSEWPQVTVVDRPADQDGCRGASLSLAYSGTGTS